MASIFAPSANVNAAKTIDSQFIRSHYQISLPQIIQDISRKSKMQKQFPCRLLIKYALTSCFNFSAYLGTLFKFDNYLCKRLPTRLFSFQAIVVSFEIKYWGCSYLTVMRARCLNLSLKSLACLCSPTWSGLSDDWNCQKRNNLLNL